MQKLAHFDTSPITTGLYEHFDSYRHDDVTTFTRLERLVARAQRRWRMAQAVRRTIASLSQLDSRELADIGMTAEQIPEVAKQAVAARAARDPNAYGAM